MDRDIPALCSPSLFVNLSSVSCKEFASNVKFFLKYVGNTLPQSFVPSTPPLRSITYIILLSHTGNHPQYTSSYFRGEPCSGWRVNGKNSEILANSEVTAAGSTQETSLRKYIQCFGSFWAGFSAYSFVFSLHVRYAYPPARTRLRMRIRQWNLKYKLMYIRNRRRGS